MGDELTGDGLGEEVGPAQVDPQHPVKGLDGGVKDVVTAGRSHAGIVDEDVDATPAVQCVTDESLMSGQIGDVATGVTNLA